MRRSVFVLLVFLVVLAQLPAHASAPNTPSEPQPTISPFTPQEEAGQDPMWVSPYGGLGFDLRTGNAPPEAGPARQGIISPGAQNVELVGQINVGPAGGVAVSGRYAYIADRTCCPGALHIIDVSDPTSPRLISSYTSTRWGECEYFSVAVVGKYAYIATACSLGIMDVEIPSAPRETGFCGGFGLVSEYNVQLAVADDYAYVPLGWGLSVINVSDPTSPHEVARMTSEFEFAYAVAVAGNYIYAASGYSGLRVIDVSEPTVPREVSLCEIPGWAWRVAVAGSYAYVSATGGLHIVDVSNPAVPREIGFYSASGWTSDVEVVGHYAYVLTQEGLHVVNVANPSAPSQAGYIGLDGGRELVAEGEYVYAVSWETGLMSILRFTGGSATYTISGRVTDASNNPIAGVIIATNAGHTATTGPDGTYTLTGLPSSTYLVTASKGRCTFTPKAWLVEVPPNRVGKDFVGDIRTPIVFVHGIMGARLFNRTSEGGSEEEVWVDPANLLSTRAPRGDCSEDDNPLMVLALAPDGASPACSDASYTSVHTHRGSAGLVTSIRIKIPVLGIKEFPVYGVLVEHFTRDRGFVEGKDFFVYTYDWRKDVRLAADDLDTLVREILSDTCASQVYILAHSMGGLVTRQYISNPDRARLVRGAVLLGSPFLGTPRALYYLLEGDYLWEPAPGIGVPLNKEVVQTLAENFPSMYEIMPSEAYFELKGGGFVSFDAKSDVLGRCPECLGYDETYSPLVPNLNVMLSEGARALHSAFDRQSDWNGVPVNLVSGYGKQTVAGIRYEWRWSPLHKGFYWVGIPIHTTAGDGSVVELSARLEGPDTGIDLHGSATRWSYESDHQGLVKDPIVLSYVDSCVGAWPVPPPVQSEEPTTDVTGAEIIAFGVEAIHCYDVLGNHTGPITPTGLVELSIPGSNYYGKDDMAVAALVGGQTYTVTVVPTGLGPLDITLVRSTMSETLTSTLYLGISASHEARITLVGDPYVVDTWGLDPDGTGRRMERIAPTSAFTTPAMIDTIAPTSTISLEGTIGSEDWYVSPVTVTVAASDEVTGTGISRIEYDFAGDPQVHIYAGPFVVRPEEVSILYVRAVDRAGNIQYPVSQARIGPDRNVFPPKMVMIAGASEGFTTRPYTFTATTLPISASLPITYTWQATEQTPVTHTGELSDTIAYAWTTTGTKVITVTATNQSGSVSDSHTIEIVSDITPTPTLTPTHTPTNTPVHCRLPLVLKGVTPTPTCTPFSDLLTPGATATKTATPRPDMRPDARALPPAPRPNWRLALGRSMP